jgi:hypothetical protein
VKVGWGEDGTATGVVAEGLGLTVLAGWLTVALAPALVAALVAVAVGWSTVGRDGGRYGSTTALAGRAEEDADCGAGL